MPINARDLHPLVYAVLSHPAFPQVAPFVVLLVLPLCALLIAHTVRRTAGSASYLLMVFHNLGLTLPWPWAAENAGGPSTSGHSRRKPRKKHRRADSVANGDARRVIAPDDGYYPGLVNVSGTYCFMNSTLQAMASLSYLDPYIEHVHTRAEALDVPTPVTDALREVLHILNTTRSAPYALRPMEIITALSTRPATDLNGRSPQSQTALFSSREHQDAQELFQLVSECLKTEAAAVDREASRDRGLSGLGVGIGSDLVGMADSFVGEGSRSGIAAAAATVVGGAGRDVVSRGVFDGLTANRRSCVECEYTEAVMHFAFDNWQLSLPRTAACRLEDCIADYTRLELLTDCICRKCSILATHRRLVQEAEKVGQAVSADPNASANKKKRAREARKLEARVRLAIEEGRIEEDVKGVKMDKVFSRASTKQAMVARPPRVLVLHLNRSIHFGNYAGKNTCRVVFPEILDLTPYTTSGKLSTTPSVPISSPPTSILPRSRTPTPATYAHSRTLYRLAAVVCHYGQHAFGHYVCFRRKPHPTVTYKPPMLACVAPECECERCRRFGAVRADDGSDVPPGSGRGWLRVSDDAVQECGVESVLAEGAGAFMLYYERVVLPRPGPYALGYSPRSSEETVRPEGFHLNGHANLSSASVDTLSSLASTSPPQANGFATVGLLREKSVGPRVVRSVAAGRGRSLSAVPPEHGALAAPGVNGHAHAQEGSVTPKGSTAGLARTGSGAEPVSLLDVPPSASELLRSIDIPSPKSAPNGAASARASPAVLLSSSAPSQLSTPPAPSSSSSSSSRDHRSTAIPSSPLPPRLRVKSPQPLHPPNGGPPLSPARLVGVGLRA